MSAKLCAAAGMVALVASAASAMPMYDIIDLGLVNATDIGVQGNAVSPNGIYATGRGFGAPTTSFLYSQVGGMASLPNDPSRGFGVGNGVNDAGIVAGTGATTSFGSSPLPLIWQSGAVAQLPLPAGETLGRANDINNNNLAVGSVNGGSLERASYYTTTTGTTITATGPGGVLMTTAYGVNDAGIACGNGIDPNNAARNVGLRYDINTAQLTEIGALPGLNGALAFGISEAGHITGSSMLNQGSGTPFVWTSGGGMVAIPLPTGATSGSGRGVNSSGWCVGNAGGVFAVPWLYDGVQTYRVQDLIPAGSGWDLSMNTSSSALGISDDGVIVGTGIHNGNTRAYMMVPIVPCPGDADGDRDVDLTDLNLVLFNFGNVVTPGTNGDVDGDGDVDLTDLNLVLFNFGNVC
ncbi:MAG: hypothetical protein KDA20_04360 [Phycisphaerales bacterium]|nr:hypothetical protein [Phycisphaerales bacterium]